MKTRIGILTGGGDCPGLNAVIYAVTMAAHERGWEVHGIEQGYAGLYDTSKIVPLTPEKVQQLKTAAQACGVTLPAKVEVAISAQEISHR